MPHLFCAQRTEITSSLVVVLARAHSTPVFIRRIQVQLEDTSRAVIDIVRSSGRDKPALGDKELEEKMTAAVERTLEVAYRCNVVVVGPGLSRDGTMQSLASRIILPLAAQNKPIIIDGDGIQILIERRDVIKPGKNIYATPNLNEFKRLWKSFMVPCVFDFHARPSILTASPCKPDSDNYPEGIDDFGAATRVIASRLGAMVVLKSEEDIVSDGRTSVLVGSYGCRKRCGGQGDLLCGIMSVLIAWKDIHMRSMIDDGELERKMKFYACQCALHIMKTAAEDTYKHFGYGMIAGDIIPNIHRATMNILVNKNLH